MRRLLAAATVLAALTAPAATAAMCAGTTGTAVACVHTENVDVDPYGGPPVGDCVYVFDDECTDVFVPTPSATSGPLVTTCCPC